MIDFRNLIHQRFSRNLQRVPKLHYASCTSTKAVLPCADPGRQGMSRRLLAWLAGCGARRLVYVSCNPATMVCITLDRRAVACCGILQRARQ